MRYLPHTDPDVREMLAAVGAETLEALHAEGVPPECRSGRPLDLPAPETEWELTARLEGLFAGAPDPGKVFLGAGCHDHHIPAVIPYLLSRGEFLTAYTPYQPEISQGTLQALFEYQTLVCRLLGMEVANASLYDGASALAEALLMAVRITGKHRVALSRAVNPAYRAVARTYCGPPGIEIIETPFGEDGRTDLSRIPEGCAALAVQSPNFFGVIEDLGAASRVAHEGGALAVACFSEPIAYGLLRSPGATGFDICCGEGRSLGLPQSFGGPALGIFTTRAEHMRRMPGRVVGETLDREGRRGFVLTLSTREQHIRREKATSNICSNESLCALGAAMHLAALGKAGLRALSTLNRDTCEYVKAGLAAAGIPARFSGPTFNEFVAVLPEGAHERLCERGFVAGTLLSGDYPELPGCVALCATETKTRDHCDAFIREAASCLRP